MAIVSLPVNKIIPSVERTQVFTDADASTGDILDLLDTLGRPAKLIRIETTGSSNLTIKRNIVQKVYPNRTEGVFDGPLFGTDVNIAQGQQVIDQSVVGEEIGPAGELHGPVSSLEVVWSVGNWTIIVS